MGTILASEIIAEAAEILHDESNVRHKATTMLRWLNAGQRDLVIMKPAANTKNIVVPLSAGTKQSLPVGGLLLLDMTRNMGANGSTPGRVPRFIERALIDRENRNWHRDAPNAEVLHYVYDDKDPLNYYVYPAQPATGRGQVELIYSAAPAKILLSTQAIGLDDIYANALVVYLLSRAYEKTPNGMDKSASYFTRFATIILGKDAVDDKVKASPRTEV